MSHQPPEHENTPEPALNRLRRVVAILRGPGGCPWDMEQTHASLVPNLLEEAYEIAEALQSDDTDHMCEELGDLLLQAFMHAEIASESESGFTLDNVAMTPHTAGASQLRAPKNIARFVRNLGLAQAGQPLEGVVDKTAGY